MSAGKRPLVVLAGWLGCRQRNLRRYEGLYSKLGWQTHSVIATPAMVVQSVMACPPTTPCMPRDWPSGQQKQTPTSMEDLAWRVWGHAHQLDVPKILVHVFSNGGCLLWEQLRLILDSSKGECASSKVLRNLDATLVGTIFDSCPSGRLEEIGRAMAFCTPMERFQASIQGGFDYWTLSHRRIVTERVRQRGREYVDRLRDHPSSIPQLYLFSESDPLAPHREIQDLVEARRKLAGKNRIWKRTWQFSPHCAHLLTNPGEYREAVEIFISGTDFRSQSKL